MSGRWFRLYDGVVDDPKVQRLPAELFRGWINVMCLACRNGGIIPDLVDLAFSLRKPEKQVYDLLVQLRKAGLVDDLVDDAGNVATVPHNWDSRQFQSDTSTERVKRFRQRSKKHEGNVSGNSEETPPETDQSRTEQSINRAEQNTDSSPPAFFSPPVQELKFLNGNGKKNEVGEKKTTIKESAERLARFQAKIAKQIGAEGWDTVVASTETWRDDYAASLAKCQAACDELGKEWPSNWPAKDMPDFLDAAKRRHA